MVYSRRAAWLRQGVACAGCSSANISTARLGRVAQAPRAGPRSRALSLVLHPVLMPISRNTVGNQLQLERKAHTTLAHMQKGRQLRHGQLPSAWRSGRQFSHIPASSVGAVQLVPETMCSGPMDPVKYCSKTQDHQDAWTTDNVLSQAIQARRNFEATCG